MDAHLHAVAGRLAPGQGAGGGEVRSFFEFYLADFNDDVPTGTEQIQDAQRP